MLRFTHRQPVQELVVMLLACWLFASVFGGIVQGNDSIPSQWSNSPIADSCTIFTATLGDKVFFGNNEDYRLWGIYAWFVPAQDITSPSGTQTIPGAVFFGFDENDDPADGYPQGGMNEHGLCMDGNGLGGYSLNPHGERDPPHAMLLAQLLWDCTTVEDVIAWFLTHTIGTSMNYQLHFADATGDAVVVSAGPDDEIAFTRINTANCLVSTNINVADPTRNVYDCWRYSTAMSMLTPISTEADLTVDACRDVLDAVHQNGQYATKYSNVFDCANRRIYLYYDRNYAQVVTLSLATELANVQPGVSGYYEQDPLFRAVSSPGDISYRKLEMTSLFAPAPNEILPFFAILTVAIIVPVVVVSGVAIYLKKRKSDSL